jgi:hypothetical protein
MFAHFPSVATRIPSACETLIVRQTHTVKICKVASCYMIESMASILYKQNLKFPNTSRGDLKKMCRQALVLVLQPFKQVYRRNRMHACQKLYAQNGPTKWKELYSKRTTDAIRRVMITIFEKWLGDFFMPSQTLRIQATY